MQGCYGVSRLLQSRLGIYRQGFGSKEFVLLRGDLRVVCEGSIGLFPGSPAIVLVPKFLIGALLRPIGIKWFAPRASSLFVPA